jgi:hypothetical protein
VRIHLHSDWSQIFAKCTNTNPTPDFRRLAINVAIACIVFLAARFATVRTYFRTAPVAPSYSQEWRTLAAMLVAAEISYNALLLIHTKLIPWIEILLEKLSLAYLVKILVFSERWTLPCLFSIHLLDYRERFNRFWKASCSHILLQLVTCYNRC